MAEIAPLGVAAAPTSQAQWEAWVARRVPEVDEVRSGVWSIPVPIPDHPMRYTLCYVFVGDGEAIVVDPGWDSRVGWDALVAGIARAGVQPADVSTIVVTHFHADHLGLAKRLVSVSGASLALGVAEYGYQFVDDFVDVARARLTLWGVPSGLMDGIEPGKEMVERLLGLMSPDRRLHDADVVEAAGSRLEVIATPGHSPGHICLIDEARGLLLTGDHVLPRISPNVPLDGHAGENPIADYLESLRAVDLGEELEVCPAHEYRFARIGQRCAALRHHSIERSREVRHVLSEGSHDSVWDVARRLTWSYGWDALGGISMRLALSETASHLRYLESLGVSTGVKITHD